MYFYECRQKVFKDIFSLIDSDIKLNKVFLTLGGVRAGIYYYIRNGIPLFVPNGIAPFHYPSVLDNLGIKYENINYRELEECFVTNDCRTDANLYIMIFTESMLGNRKIENVKENVFGDSQLTLKYLDISNNKIILNHQNESKYWIDIDIYKAIENRSNVSLTNKIGIYKINKSDIIENKNLIRIIKQNDMELLNKNIDSFFKDNIIRFGEGSYRLDGKKAYCFLTDKLLEIRKEYTNSLELKDKSRLGNYILLLSKQYKLFVTAGSETNYRNEFAECINSIYGGNKEIFSNRWKEMGLEWVRLTLELTKLYVKEDVQPLDILDTLIDFHKNIAVLEFKLMSELKEAL